MNAITTLTPAEAAARVREIADDVWYRYGHLMPTYQERGQSPWRDPDDNRGAWRSKRATKRVRRKGGDNE